MSALHDEYDAGIDALRAHAEDLRRMTKLVRTIHDQLIAERGKVAKMQPVFDAAIRWSEWWRHDWNAETALEELGDACDRYYGFPESEAAA